MEAPPPADFLEAAPAYAVARTHECVRDRRLLKLYAPLSEAEEATMFTPADAAAVTAFRASGRDGYAGFLRGCGTLEASPDHWSSSWVQWSVDSLERIAWLLLHACAHLARFKYLRGNKRPYLKDGLDCGTEACERPAA